MPKTVPRYFLFKNRSFRSKRFLLLAAVGIACQVLNFSLIARDLVYAPAPPDNPLKGMVPFVEAGAGERFPHSMEYQEFVLRDLMVGRDKFDWSKVEATLTITQSRGCQLIPRVILEKPDSGRLFPEFLIEDGLSVTTWTRDAELDGGVSHTPDYENEKLRTALRSFIIAFGKKYDGDPRIGFIFGGLLGSWGEWHTSPRLDLWASHETQRIVLDAFEEAFVKTPVLLRRPAGKGDAHYAENVSRGFGYHDDSFSWSTVRTSPKDQDWYFLPLLESTGAGDAWKTSPIGGELRPELRNASFTNTLHPRDQGFRRCVDETHASWLLDAGLFEEQFPLSDERKRAAIVEVQHMGYEFFVSKWSRQGSRVFIQIENRGVAPFYHDWPVILSAGNQEVAQFDLRGILPGESAEWTAESRAFGQYFLEVPNPMDGGKMLRFANREVNGKGRLALP